MFKVIEATDKGGRSIAVVRRDGRIVASASFQLIEWMGAKDPDHQLSPTQAALVEWYATRTLQGKPISRRESVG